MNILFRIFCVLVLIFLFRDWFDSNESDTSADGSITADGPSKTELKIADMTKQFSTVKSTTDFKTLKFYNMTDVQRKNWEDANKDSLHLIVDRTYEVVRKTEKLTPTGGYNRYSIQFLDAIEDALKRTFANSNYHNLGFDCKNIYAYNQQEKNAIENLQVGDNVTFLAKDVNLGSLWHTADICVIKGIHK